MKEYSLITLLFFILLCSVYPACANRNQIAYPDLGSQFTQQQQSDKYTQFAQYLSHLGEVLSQMPQQNSGEYLSQQLRAELFASLSQRLQLLLSRYGAVKIQFGSDRRKPMQGAKFDYLVPLYESDNNMLFNQFSVQGTDYYTYVNWGVGQRWRLNDNKRQLGYYAFYDYEPAYTYQRLGLGFEAMVDDFIFYANYYLPLSGWQDSGRRAFMQANSATGFDSKIITRLPYYPNIGLMMKYERYFGQQVILSGSNRYRSPSNLILQIDYQPIPLLTISGRHRQGSQYNDNSLRFSLNYLWHVPLMQQLEPRNVNLLNLLHKHLPQFTERRQRMVLQYR